MWTAHHWQHWLDHGEFPDHPWRTYLQRSALTLKGLSYAPTGALVAAATTSLPETPGGERNWDYRYTWIRDSTFTLWGLYTLGFDWEANDFFYFIADVAEAEEGQLQIMYGIDGEAELAEETLDHLTGYEGARPVRIGNGAYDQEPARRLGRGARLLLPAHQVARPPAGADLADPRQAGRGRARRTGASPTAASGRCAASPKHFTSSKLMCWVALDRGARLAEIREDAERARGVAEVGATRSTPTSARTPSTTAACSASTTTPTTLDASVLLMPLVRFLPPGRRAHPRRPCSRSPTS